MTTETSNTPSLEEENASLRAQIQSLEQQVNNLNSELAETNQGVVALYAELDNNAIALREASELKSRFLSYMSHEFRTPLGSIRSIARILLDHMDGPLTGEQTKQVKFIQHAAVELNETVNDLLDLAKIEAGRLSISPAWFELVDLFEAIRGMFKPLLVNDAVSLILEEPREMPRVYTDDKKLSQILRNFISNALKFTAVGEIRVSVCRSGDNEVRFSVSDTGIGIAPEHHHAIFKDFVQIDSPTQRKWRGTGLGLSLSKKFAELLGGSVSMQSEPNVGSTFSVTVPLRYDGPEPAETGVETSDGRTPWYVK